MMKRVRIILLACWVAFGGLEGAYRLYKLDQYGMIDYPDVLSLGYFEPHPQYGYVAKKNFHSDSLPAKTRNHPRLRIHFGQPFSTNSWGYRGREFSIQKNPDTFRIVVLGGSTTMCMELPDEETWSARLEAGLNSDPDFLRRHGKKKVEVINASNGGWKSREVLIRLQQEVCKLNPDLILLALNWNDTWRGISGEDTESPEQSSRPWWYHVKLFQNLRIRYLRSTDYNPAYNNRLRLHLRRDQGWVHSFVWNLVQMQRTASQIHASAMLVDLPGLCRVQSLGTPEYQQALDQTRVTAVTYPLLAEVKEFESALFQDMGRELQIPVLDVAGRMEHFSGSERPKLFIDEMHVTKWGATQIARAVQTELSAHLPRPVEK